jgi:hypothetical protein
VFYAYGHIVNDGRHMIISGGLGTSIAPIRIGVPPEIVHIEIRAGDVLVARTEEQGRNRGPATKLADATVMKQ